MTQQADRVTRAPGVPLADDAPLEQIAEALDAAMAGLTDLEPAASRIIDGVLESLNRLHHDALVTVVRRLRDDPRGKELLFELVDDPGVHMVLAMHGILRPDPNTSARQVLDRVRPGLQSHGGDVELDRIEGGVAFVRLRGACNGCSMAAVTMREGVEKALVEGVAGVTGVEVLPNEPEPTLIPLSSIGVGAPDDTGPDLAEAGWVRARDAEGLPVGGLRTVVLAPPGEPGVEAIVVNAAGQLAAYVNECAHLGLPLDEATVDPIAGTLTCPHHGFCYEAATGECLTMPGAQLEQLPLRLQGDQVWIRTAGAV
jgi:Fe-S cluster biogenesis protein NfuA/nitrite reductase/ring-hydroxylating ferredoxin subunit